MLPNFAHTWSVIACRILSPKIGEGHRRAGPHGPSKNCFNFLRPRWNFAHAFIVARRSAFKKLGVRHPLLKFNSKNLVVAVGPLNFLRLCFFSCDRAEYLHMHSHWYLEGKFTKAIGEKNEIVISVEQLLPVPLNGKSTVQNEGRNTVEYSRSLNGWSLRPR